MKKSGLVVSGVIALMFLSTGAVLANETAKSENQEATVEQEQTAKEVESQVDNYMDFLHGTRENVSVEKVIEVNSVNFIKLRTKPTEIFIPDPKIADVDMLDDNSLYLLGKTPGVTSLIASDKTGNVIADYLVKVTHPISLIKKAIADVYPDIDLQLASLDKSLLVKGKVPSPEMAADILDIVGRFVEQTKIVNKMSIETATQVMLKVKIAEVYRELTKSLGIDWRALSIGKGISSMTYGFSGNTAASVSGKLPEFGDIAALRTALSNKENPIFSKTAGEWLVTSNGNSGGLSALISAMATESFASVLAEPTLVTLSGKKAVFKSGGEQPYTVRQSGTNDSNTTEFKEWGTSLEFTPVVLSEDRIKITVKPIVSTLVVSGESDDRTPSLSKKEAETTVELGSGQSFAIAGLLQSDKNSISEETPFLADLPLVGALFRNSQVKRTERELVIIVTPYVVKPSSKQLKTPIDMMPRMYSPLESIITRKFHKNAKKNKQSFRLSAGYSLR